MLSVNVLHHASAKQVPEVKSPFTQATDQMKGSLLLFVKAAISEFGKT